MKKVLGDGGRIKRDVRLYEVELDESDEENNFCGEKGVSDNDLVKDCMILVLSGRMACLPRAAEIGWAKLEDSDGGSWETRRK